MRSFRRLLFTIHLNQHTKLSAPFDKAASWYDRLATLVYGQRLLAAQREMLEELPENGRVLWVGGGTGTMLPVLLESRPHLHVDYLEESSRMISIAAGRITGREQQVSFATSLEYLEPREAEYDAVLLFFVMDVFETRELSLQLQKWLRYANPQGKVLVAEFCVPAEQPGRMLAKVLIPTMYSFFRLSIGMSNTRLPDWKGCLEEQGFQEVKRTERLLGIILSACWQVKG
ncbi:MAG: class I SAM-dependent methyltransferase [Bacteroidia bacterium]|nr:class I SAM-dependent methyltransferase [Bacteroidia bacterium]